MKKKVKKKAIPKREQWLYKNPEALASVKRGLKQAGEMTQSYNDGYKQAQKDMWLEMKYVVASVSMGIKPAPITIAEADKLIEKYYRHK